MPIILLCTCFHLTPNSYNMTYKSYIGSVAFSERQHGLSLKENSEILGYFEKMSYICSVKLEYGTVGIFEDVHLSGNFARCE